MKKKILFILLVLFLLILVGTVIYCQEKDKKHIILKETLEPSQTAKYLQKSIPTILQYLSTNEVTSEIDFAQMQINEDNCTGQVIPGDNTYLIKGKCQENKSGYNISYMLTKTPLLKKLYSITEVNGGYIFSGGSIKDNEDLVGFIDNKGNLKWQVPIERIDNESYLHAPVQVDDGYVFLHQTFGKNNNKVKAIKIDGQGNIVFEKTIMNDLVASSIKSNNKDAILIANNSQVILLDNSGNEIKKFNLEKIQVVTYEKNKIYYINKNNKLFIFDDKGQKINYFKLKNIKDIFILEVINGKILVSNDSKVQIYDDKGKKQKEYIYDNLAVPQNKNTGEWAPTVIIDNIRFNDNVYINSFLMGYSMVDRYDSKLELINRSLYKTTFEDIGTTNYDMKITMGEEIANHKYSEKYKMIVKTIYN